MQGVLFAFILTNDVYNVYLPSDLSRIQLFLFDKWEFVFALLITLIQQEQNFWLEFFSYIVNIVLQYGIRSISVSFQ